MSRVCGCGQPKAHNARTCARCFHESQRLFRYPYQPLEEMLGGSDESQARQLGVSRHAVRGLIRRGLSPWQADRYAVRAGVHPSALWPSWFTDALTEENAA